MADEQHDPVTVPTLVMTGGPLDGTAYALPLSGRETVVGSSLDADVQILLGNVESFHARVRFESGALVIVDAGSATGTFVNGEKLEGPHPLQEGDRVCLGPPGAKGSAKLVVRLPGGSAASPALDGASATPSLAEHGPAPALDQPSLLLGAQDEGPPPFALPSEDELADSGALLEADEGRDAEAAPGEAGLTPVEQADDLPVEPLPSLAAAVIPPLSAAAAPPAPAFGRSAPAPAPPPPPASARPAIPPPPAPAAAGSPKLTAPPPPPPRPEYRNEVPSIPVAEPQPARTPTPEPFPHLRPAARPARPSPSPARKPRAVRRRSMPVLPLVRILAVVAAIVVVVALVMVVRPLLPRKTPPEIASVRPASPGPGETPSARATALDPEVAMPGQSVLIRGEGFSGQRVSVQFAGMPSPSVEEVPGGLRVVVPQLPLPEGSTTSVVVDSGGKASRSFPFIVGRLPLVIQATPARGAIGERVVLNGRGFDPEARSNLVTFGGRPALVLSATTIALTVVAPAPPSGDVQPDFPIAVTARGRSSSSNVSYTYQRRATSGFRPRFFAAAVPELPKEDLAFVSTELGPVLLLAGAGGGSSSAERAVAVASALNAAVDAAATRRAVFELRERPASTVGIAGDPRPLLVATDADAAAYSKAWETPAGAARRVAPGALAQHWRAILQDYFGLFLYRERPLQLLTLSSRAQVLSEIYGEATRRAPGSTNVPTDIVLPTPASMTVALRRMALVVSVEPGRAAVAVEGRWEGSIVDPDRGDSRFRLNLRIEEGRLAGTITTWQGRIEVTSQLREVAFEGGSLRFTAPLQGAQNRFTGALQGNTVTGSIERPGRPPARFTLDYSE